MWIDTLAEFSDGQAMTATAVSTNVYDLGKARQVGKGNPLYVHVSLDVAADDTDGNETYEVQVQTDSTDAFGSPVVLATLNIPRGSPAGYHDKIAIPDKNVEQFLRLNYVLAGTTPSMTISAWLSGEEGQSWEANEANTGL